EDAWRLRLQLAERMAGDAATLRREAATRFPDAQWWQRAPAPAEYSRFVSVVWGGERLSIEAPDWRRQSVRLDWQTAAGVTLFGEAVRTERFARTDSAGSLGGAWQALPQWRLGGALAAVTGAEFEPARELSLEAQRSW